MPDERDLAAELERLRALVEELRVRLSERDALVARQAERIEQLERQLGKDSSNSSKPPSSDSPYGKKKRDRSLRGKTGRRPGKQPGAPGVWARLAEHPDVVVCCPAPAECGRCGRDLTGVTGRVRRCQVREVPAPAPVKVTEYRIEVKRCPCCRVRSHGLPPAPVRAAVCWGPRTAALAANLICGQYLPVGRAAALMTQMTGAAVSAGWIAGLRGRAAAMLEPFTARVSELLAAVPVLHADETPARAEGKLAYVHVAATAYLTHLHTGGRSAADIDAGGVLPAFDGVLVRDGYAGYHHLTSAAHAWCGAHMLRDLKDVYDFEPGPQAWAKDMAGLLVQANQAAAAARAAGAGQLNPDVLNDVVTRYRQLAAAGLEANRHRHTRAARDAKRVARRLRDYEDLILRFAADLAVPFTNNEAERTIRPVKVQQRASGGCWRTLAGLADFAVVHAYLSTAAKWDINPLDALTQLFTTGPWLPPAATPAT